ncbi:MAG TPA: HAD family phosphatase [Acidimicrobiia bacterium]|nr:HAD family phosphatase [Acidimicrobiia bacterium]
MTRRALIFDLGGVVLDSPLEVIAAYEEENRIPAGTINRHVASRGDEGAWGRHERGEIDFADFCELFEAELAGEGFVVEAAVLLAQIGAFAKARPAVLDEVGRLRTIGYKVAALTNSWQSLPDYHLHSYFDLVVESWREGVRKPDREIFVRTLTRLDVDAAEALMIDDLGPNLKAARDLGMETFKAVDEASLIEFLKTLG